MISPGCSFTFDGLKQTLLAVQDGIEDKLSKVSNLLKNYRTSKEVLNLANEILRVGKREFPNTIPFAKKEVAMKDLGLKVVLCDWKAAYAIKVRLGANQALIYSSVNPEAFKQQATKWIGQHPFTLTALESKGLEFDDVIVAFDIDRKVWNVSDKRAASLNMIRELYVAVTRAQRRLVILVKKGIPEMRAFFDCLDCDYQQDGAEMVLQEFDKVTTPEMWRDRGRRLFQNERFRMAADCFASAGDQGWLHWSEGCHWETMGLIEKASIEFWKAMKIFYDRKQYELILDISTRMPSSASWDSECNEVLKEALHFRPHYLSRFDIVKLSLKRNAWEEVKTDDLKDESLSSQFLVHRKHPSLHKLVGECSTEDRRVVERVLPLVVIEYFQTRQEHVEAIRVCLASKKLDEAAKSTNAAIAVAKQGKRLKDLPDIVRLWTSSSQEALVERYQAIGFLLLLFSSPVKASSQGKEVLHFLGKNIVVFAVKTADLDLTMLYDFSSTEFLVEVTQALSKSLKPLEIVRWFCDKSDTNAAQQYVSSRLNEWTFDETYEIVHMVRPWPQWLLEEVHRKKGLRYLIIRVVASQLLCIEEKRVFVDLASNVESSITQVVKDEGFNSLNILNAILWCIDDMVPGSKKIVAVKKSNKAGKKQKKVSHGDATFGVFARAMILAWSFGETEIGTGTKSKASTRHIAALFYPNQCRQLVLAALGSVSAKDQNTMIQFFLKYDKKEHRTSLLMLEQLLHRKFWKTAIDLSGGCLGSRNMAERNLQGVISIWQNHSESLTRRKLNGTGTELLFAKGHILSTLLILARDMRAVTSDDDWLIVLKKYGPAVASYVKLNQACGGRDKPNEKSMCTSMESIVQFNIQLRREVRRRSKLPSILKATKETSKATNMVNDLKKKMMTDSKQAKFEKGDKSNLDQTAASRIPSQDSDSSSIKPMTTPPPGSSRNKIPETLNNKSRGGGGGGTNNKKKKKKKKNRR